MIAEAVTVPLSIVGATTGVASLLWQVISWRRTGPDLRLQAKLHWSRGPKGSNYEDDRFSIEVDAYNKGRGGVGVVNLWVECSHIGFRDEQPHVLHRQDNIDGHHGERWVMHFTSGAEEIPSQHHKNTRVCVRLGNGKVVRTKLDWAEFEAFRNSPPRELLR